MTNVKRRAVVLTGTGLQHRYVAQALARVDGVHAVVFVHEPKQSFATRLDKGRRRYGSTGLSLRLATRVALRLTGEHGRRTRQIGKLLGEPTISDPTDTFETTGVNSEETCAVLRNLSADIVCVYGTSIVRKPTLDISALNLNLHTGISPDYRGADCAFWPLHNRELDLLGATVHVCTDAIDGGSIFGTRQARLEPDDEVGAVFARSVMAGAELYAEVVRDLLSGEREAVPQAPHRGREYKARMRDWKAEWRVDRLIRQGIIRNHCEAMR